MRKVEFSIGTKFLPAIQLGDFSALDASERSALKRWIGCSMHQPGGFWSYYDGSELGFCEVERREGVPVARAVFTY
ncbi:MAG: hypothetical protein EBV86_01290 [Marivivens sp.]|nr:hypothetical protein [Marivivens sp.]NBT49970.1 hypothetical protein [Marivivens sp.]NCW67190.1 hypothetical protein [Marivivens sp.]